VIFFGIITHQAIRRGTFTSVTDLTDAIRRCIDACNDRCQPFAWTKSADEPTNTQMVSVRLTHNLCRQSAKAESCTS
jgi:hypothetical protein